MTEFHYSWAMAIRQHGFMALFSIVLPLAWLIYLFRRVVTRWRGSPLTGTSRAARVAGNVARTLGLGVLICGWVVFLRFTVYPLLAGWQFQLSSDDIAEIRIDIVEDAERPDHYLRTVPGKVSVTDLDRIREGVGMLNESSRYLWNHESPIGRQYFVRFRRKNESRWATSTIWLIPSTEKGLGRVESGKYILRLRLQPGDAWWELSTHLGDRLSPTFGRWVETVVTNGPVEPSDVRPHKAKERVKFR